MRVLLIGLNYAPEVSGIAPYSASLAAALNNDGHQVRVLTTQPHYPEWKFRDGYRQRTKTSIENDVKVVRLRHYLPNRPIGIRRLLSELSFGLRAFSQRWGNPDIVVLVSPALFATALGLLKSKLYPPRRRPAVIVWVQDLYGLGLRETGTSGNVTASLMSSIEGRILRSADGVAVIHERFKDHVSAVLGVDPNDIEVIRNWTHLPPNPQGDRATWRAHLGWKNGETIVLHAGNQGVKQGLENVIEAARFADASQAAVRFVLLGGGSQHHSLRESARGIDRIEFLDSLPESEFQRALLCADVLLVNEISGISGMAAPSKLTSYFNTGLPVVAATDSGSLSAEELDGAAAGIRVNAGDPQALLATILMLRNEPQLAQRLGQSGLAYRERAFGAVSSLSRFGQWLASFAAKRESKPGAFKA